jgi:filamentous hemagglutinin
MAHAILGGVIAELSGGNAASGASGAMTGELAAPAIALAFYGTADSDKLTSAEKENVSALATLASGIAAGMASDSASGAVTGAQAGKNAVENNSLSLVARGCAAMAPCRTKVAEQLLEIGAKAGIVGLAGVAIKDVADKMTSDELDHLVTLEMMGNDEITGKYLVSLQGKYAPLHTGNNDGQVNTGPNHTGNNNSQANIGPNHTGNNDGQINTGPNHTGGDQSVEQLSNNTGNVEGAPDLPNHMESQGYEPNKNAVGNMGEFLKQPGFGSTIKDNTQKTNQQYQGQSIYKATDNVGDYIKKDDQFYLDGLHKDHIEVFDKRGNFRAVLNLDGSINERKTQEAEGRKLK